MLLLLAIFCLRLRWERRLQERRKLLQPQRQFRASHSELKGRPTTPEARAEDSCPIGARIKRSTGTI
jgi:hypothetical protein